MSGDLNSTRIAADVKCYFCGHISGQIIGQRGVPLRASNFIPRPGYQGEPPRPGIRMRCERCHGPVFLEDAPALPLAGSVGEKPRPRTATRQKAA